MRSELRHIFVLLVCSLLATACGSIFTGAEEESSDVTFVLKVSVSDMPGAPSSQTKAGYEDAVSDGERMQTLRIMIVRPDGTVEHNEYYDFASPLLEAGPFEYKVAGLEKKKVYLVVNEGTERPAATTGGTTVEKVVGYDFSGIAVGSAFPTAAVSGLLISLPSDDAEMPLPLPMSECHEVYIPSKDYETELFVVRAATKFTYEFRNNTSRAYTVGDLTIERCARKEYFLPRNTSYNFAPSYTDDYLTENEGYGNEYEVNSYEVPSIGTNEYYVFTKNITGTVPAKTGDIAGAYDPAPIYLLESKYDPDGDSSTVENYSMSVVLNGDLYASTFPNLEQLPRNTNVVVRIIINEYGLEWTVDVYPYGEYWLYPGFGL